MECWARDPDERPTFHALRELLWKFQEEDHSYVNLDDNVVLPPTAQGTSTIIFFSSLGLLKS